MPLLKTEMESVRTGKTATLFALEVRTTAIPAHLVRDFMTPAFEERK